MGGRKWTQEELDKLESMWGTFTLPGIAKSLNRTQSSIRCMITRLALGTAESHSGMVSARRLVCTIYGKEVSKYQQKIEEMKALGLHVHNRILGCSRKTSYVDLADFWKFAEKHQDMLDFSRFEPFSFGMEPEWVAGKRKADERRRLSVKNMGLPWSAYDIQIFMRMAKSGKYSMREIADRLGRTVSACYSYRYKLGCFPITKPSWSDEEEQILFDMMCDGKRVKEVAEVIGRTRQAVYHKLREIRRKSA